MSSLPQVPFGLRLPGTDGFSLPQGAVPGGPMPAPLPDGMGQESEAFGFQPPPAMPPPPSEPDQLQGRSMQAPMENLPTTPGGGLAPTPQVGNSDQKWGLKQWLPLILGTVGAGVWAGKNKSLTDFGTNLLQGAAKQTFDQLEEKRKRQFDLDTANLKQGQEAIKDLIAINDNDLNALQKEVENNPQFAHVAAYIQPLREAKQKYSDFTQPGSDGGIKITAKEAAELAHYYNSVKAAKEAINSFRSKSVDYGFEQKKLDAQTHAKYAEAYNQLKSVMPDLTDAQIFSIWSRNGGQSGDWSSAQRLKMLQAAQLAVNTSKAKTIGEVMLDQGKIGQALNDWEVHMAGAKSGAQSNARLGNQLTIKNEPPAVQMMSDENGRLVPARYDPKLQTYVPMGGPGKAAPLDPTAAKGLSTSSEIGAQYSQLEDKLDKLGPKLPTGFLQGRITMAQLAGQLPSNLTPEEANFLSTMQNDLNVQINRLSGTAVSAGEEARLAKALPMPTNNYSDIKAKIKAVRDIAITSAIGVAESNPGAAMGPILGHATSVLNSRQKQEFDSEVQKAEQAMGPLTAKQKIMLLSKIRGRW